MNVRIIPIFIVLILLSLTVSAKHIPIAEAMQTAKNYLTERSLGKGYSINLSLKHIETKSDFTAYYVFENSPNGFVIVSADDKFYPIIGYSLDNNFKTENQPEHVVAWFQTYTEQIEYASKNEVKQADEIAKLWAIYNQTNFTPSVKAGAKSVPPLVGDILWDQADGWNGACPVDEAGPGGRALAGCVATAMGIVLKFWEYPIHGSGSHSYYCHPYGTLSANYETAPYFWNLMPNNEPTAYTAYLLYHLGVAVNMEYAADGSGASSSDVPGAFINYFGISASCNIKARSSYSEAEWITNILKPQIDAGRPIYYGGYHAEDGGHAFVCSGYDENDYFHFNFGWSGYDNGFYTVADVNGFNQYNSAVVNILPAESNVYPAAPSSLTADINLENLAEFEVLLQWEAPAESRNLTGYKLYRGTLFIAEVGAGVTTYSDITTADNLDYAVQAIYSDGVSLAASDDVSGLFYVTFKVYSATGSFLSSNALGTKVTFQGITKNTGFGSASFNNTPYGGQQLWEASSTGHPTTSGYVDVTKAETFKLYLTGSQASVENDLKNEINLYPNPAKSFLSVDMPLTGQISYQIFDISGKLVQSGLLDEPTIQLNNLNSGTYFIQIIGKDQRVVKQFVVD